MPLQMTKLVFSACVTAFLCSASTTASAESQLAGKWVGTVYETNVGSYVVAVEISSDGNSGNVEYRRYPCGGSLSLISGNGAQNLYAESLTFGQDLCLDGLSARLTLTGANSVYFEEIVSGSSAVYGTLERVSAGVDVSCSVAGLGLLGDVGTCFSTSLDKTICIEHAMRKYEGAISNHQDRCFLTCGKILHECIANTRPRNNPDGTYGCVEGMRTVTCDED